MPNRAIYSQLIDTMINDASVLRTLVEFRIGEAFPISEPSPIEAEGFVHEQTDCLGYGQSTATLDDSFSAYEVIAKIQEILFSMQMILESIYPEELQNGSMTVQVGKNFNQVIESTKNDLQLLLKIKEAIMGGQQSRVVECVDHTQVRKLRDHFIVLGYETALNDWEAPAEFRSNVGVTLNKQEIKQIEQAITPQIAQLASLQINPNSTFLPNSDQLSKTAKSLLSNLR